MRTITCKSDPIRGTMKTDGERGRGSQVELQVDSTEFPLPIVLKAACNLLDRFDIKITGNPRRIVEVRLRSLRPGLSPEESARTFWLALEAARDSDAKFVRASELRSSLVQAALLGTVEEMEPLATS